jgi:aryl-alcohol dehydrogenase-like predicted oxidoreductase
MRYKILGRSGLRVSELALGTMTFGTEWGWGSDLETSKKVFETYTNTSVRTVYKRDELERAWIKHSGVWYR